MEKNNIILLLFKLFICFSSCNISNFGNSSNQDNNKIHFIRDNISELVNRDTLISSIELPLGLAPKCYTESKNINFVQKEDSIIFYLDNAIFKISDSLNSKIYSILFRQLEVKQIIALKGDKDDFIVIFGNYYGSNGLASSIYGVVIVDIRNEMVMLKETFWKYANPSFFYFNSLHIFNYVLYNYNYDWMLEQDFDNLKLDYKEYMWKDSLVSSGTIKVK